METLSGVIIKGIGGFYYVEAANEVYECKARGAFRKEKITPLAGDNVIISINDNAENTIDEILPRKNFLTRPPVSNIDNLIIVASTIEPKPSTLVIDKLIAVAEHKSIEPVLVISKTDLASCDMLVEAYSKCGIRVITVSNETGDGVDEVRSVISGKINAFTGNSGVGKTSLLNNIDTSLSQKTAKISDKLGRGRHTTRQAELFKVGDGYVVDTAGFSSFEIDRSDVIMKDELPYCFREFLPYLDRCKFNSCSHVCDKGCAIVEAVNSGLITKSRHDSYVALYNEVKDLKEWNL